MKTPRKLLLERNAAALPRLEALHAAALAAGKEMNARPTPGTGGEKPIARGFFLRAWQELVWPCRGVWGTLAAVWAILAVVHFSDRGAGGLDGLKVGVPSAAKLAVMQEQQLRQLTAVLPALAQARAKVEPVPVRLPDAPKTSEWTRRNPVAAV